MRDMMNSNYDETKRKWFLQMSQAEVYALRGVVLKHSTWEYTPHALVEMEDDRISKDDVQKVLKYGKVMEAHNCDPNDLCVLLRYTINNRSIAVVVSVCYGKIITAFANSVESGMRKPDMKNYKWTVTLSEIKHISPTNLEAVQT